MNSLRLEHTAKTLRPLLLRFMQHTSNRGNFNEPVNPKSTAGGTSLADYHSKVRHPIDFSTIKAKLHALQYKTAEQFAADMRLVFSNAMLYYHPAHELYEAASTMSAEFEQDYDKLVKKAERGNQKKGEHACSLCQGETCALCGAKCLKYEPPAIVCDGPCAQRLRRGATFYITHDGTRLWCQRCHGGLNSVLPPPDGTEGMAEYMDPEEKEKVGKGAPPPSLLYKRDLLRRKFDEEIAEPWVQCDACQRWVHQTCALFNDRSNATPNGTDARFCCPECEANTKIPPMKVNIKLCGETRTILDGRTSEKPDDAMSCAASVGSDAQNRFHSENVKAETTQMMEETKHEGDGAASGEAQPQASGPAGSQKPTVASQNKWWASEELPHCNMGRFIETKCNQRLAALLGYGEDSVSDGNYAVLGDKKVTIRVVSTLEATCEVNYAVRKYFHAPRHLPYRSKALMMFQKVDGIDIALWCMYVQEYGKECPAPSTRRAYIAYLDSVEYFRPRHVRTQIYHEILVSYLAWLATRGFTHAHIWACPPYRGNNFIFWCHPAHQRTPSSERLVQWYRTMLERGKEVGCVGSVETLYKASFERFAMDTKELKALQESDPTWDALEQKAPVGSCPPIFDGDMWLDEAVVANRRIVNRKEQLAEGGTSPFEGCCLIMKKLTSHPSAYPFNTPVDPVSLNIPNYTKVVTKPMDLGTAKSRLHNGEYTVLKELFADVHQTFANAKMFNPPKHPVHTMATTLCAQFDKEVRFLLAKWQQLIPQGTQGPDYLALNIKSKDEENGAAVESRQAASECSSAPNTDAQREGSLNAISASPSKVHFESDNATKDENRGAAKDRDSTGVVTCSMSSCDDGDTMTEHQPIDQLPVIEQILDTDTQTREESGRSVQFTGHNTADVVSPLFPSNPPHLVSRQDSLHSADPTSSMHHNSVTVCNGLAQHSNDVFSKPLGQQAVPATHQPPPLPPNIRATPEIPQQHAKTQLSPAPYPMNGFAMSPATPRSPRLLSTPGPGQHQFYGSQPSSGLRSSDLTPRTPRSQEKANNDRNERNVTPATSKLEWEVMAITDGKVQLRCRPPAQSQPAVPTTSNTAGEIVLPPPRKPPSLPMEHRLPLPAQVARTIEKMKNDFFVVNLCPPGTELPEGKLNMEALPQHGVQFGPSSGAGRRRKAQQVEKAKKKNNQPSKKRKVGKAPNSAKAVPIDPDDFLDSIPGEAPLATPGGSALTVPSPATADASIAISTVPTTPADNRGSCGNTTESALKETTPSVLAVDTGLPDGAGTAGFVKIEDSASKTEPAEMFSAGVDGVQDYRTGMTEEADDKKTGATYSSIPSDTRVKTELPQDESTTNNSKGEFQTEPTKKLVFAQGLELNPTLAAYLANVPLPDTKLMEDTNDPDGLQSRPYVDSRHTFLEMCQWRHYQFDTLRRAKHASLMGLYHLHNSTPESNKAHAAHCAQCGKQIKGVRWHCPVCPDFELCSGCNTHDSKNVNLHPHLLTPYRVSYEGELRA